VGLRASSERGDFLMSHMKPLDLALPSNGISQPVEAIPNDAIDPLHTHRRKRRGKLFGNGYHLILLNFRNGRANRSVRQISSGPAGPAV
jgi:hypothetical protein